LVDSRWGRRARPVILGVRLRKLTVPISLNMLMKGNFIRSAACIYLAVLAVCLPASTNASMPDDSAGEAEGLVPDAIASEMVRIVIKQTFDDGVADSPIFVSSENLEASWFEGVSDERIRVLTREQVQDKDRAGESYYSLTEPGREEGGTYCLGMLYGTRCQAEGRLYRFRVGEHGLELWRTKSGISRMC